MLWHGYIVFRKPASVSKKDWSTVLRKLAQELDETPDAPQPAERWHTATNEDETIAEANFDLMKLNTPELTRIAGVDMTNAWDAMRLNQDWYLSSEKVKLPSYPIFYPEDYGTIGNSPEEDMTAVQAAINAAGESGGGRVICNGDYSLCIMGHYNGRLWHGDYALLVQEDNVSIEGSGTFRLMNKPDTNQFVGIMFGSYENLFTNNAILDLTFDGSALSDADRADISQVHTSHVVIFANCRNWLFNNITVIDGWGGNCCLGSQASSRNGVCLECDVKSGASGYGGTTFAYWFDGARDVIISGCKSSTPAALSFQANLDNTQLPNGTAGHAKNNSAINNDFTNIAELGKGRWSCMLSGTSNTQIINNRFTGRPGVGMWGVYVQVQYRKGNPTAPAKGNKIDGNVFESMVSEARAITIKGMESDPNTGASMSVEDLLFTNNELIGFYKRGLFENKYCVRARFSGNKYPVQADDFIFSSQNDKEFLISHNEFEQ
jgi:hypothetical protein